MKPSLALRFDGEPAPPAPPAPPAAICGDCACFDRVGSACGRCGNRLSGTRGMLRCASHAACAHFSRHQQLELPEVRHAVLVR